MLSSSPCPSSASKPGLAGSTFAAEGVVGIAFAVEGIAVGRRIAFGVGVGRSWRDVSGEDTDLGWKMRRG